MEHQDWNTVVLTKKKEPPKSKLTSKPIFKSAPDVDIKLEAPPNLGQLICQARTVNNKTQKVLASELGIAAQVLARWETNKDIPNNAELAKIEKNLRIKLPRIKKTKLKSEN